MQLESKECNLPSGVLHLVLLVPYKTATSKHMEVFSCDTTNSLALVQNKSHSKFVLNQFFAKPKFQEKLMEVRCTFPAALLKQT